MTVYARKCTGIDLILERHMTRWAGGNPSFEAGLANEIASFLGSSKIELSSWEKVRNIFLNFLTLGVWSLIQSARFQMGMKAGDWRGLSQAASAIHWGANVYLSIDQVSSLIRQNKKSFFHFYLAQMEGDDFARKNMKRPDDTYIETPTGRQTFGKGQAILESLEIYQEKWAIDQIEQHIAQNSSEYDAEVATRIWGTIAQLKGEV